MRACFPRRIRLISAVPLISIVAIYAGSAGADTLTFESRLSQSDVRVVSIGGQSVVRIENPKAALADGYQILSDPGSPSLPIRVVRFILPDGHTVAGFDAAPGVSRILSESFHPELTAAPRDPDSAPAAALPRLIEPPAEGPFPGEFVRYLGTGYWQGHAIASFALLPFQVDGTRLELYERVSLTVETRPHSEPPTIARLQRLSPGRSEEIRSQLAAVAVNADAIDGYRGPVPLATAGPFEPTMAPSLDGSPVEYLIVTTDALADAYQRLADWKTARGVPTVVRTMEWIDANHRRGSDIQETLRLFIRDAYEKWGVKWVLLGGDTAEIPARYCFSTYYYGGRYLPVDLYYAGLDGSWNKDHDDVWGEPSSFFGDAPDLYAEVYLGRLPTSSVAGVDIMVDKIIDYESAVDPSYLNKVMFLAEVLFPFPWSPGQTIEVNGADSAEYVILGSPELHALNLVRAYETDDLYPGSIHESVQQTIDSLNAGYNHVHHIGHGFRFNMHLGDASLVISDADALHNGDRQSNLYLLNCTAAAFDYDCLAERFLKNPSGGAVSVVGSNESAFPDASIHYEFEYTRLVFSEGVVHIGEAFARSRLPRTAYAETADNSDLWTHYVYTLLADPEMRLWTDTVDTLVVTHTTSTGMGINTIQVEVAAGGAPAESVLVCLWKKDDDYQHGSTGGTGAVSFDFACESPGSVSVVATGANHTPYQGWITVDPEPGGYLDVVGFVVDDTTAAGIVGNGDGLIDAGETINLYPVFENTGGTATGAAIVTMSSGSPWVSAVDNVAVAGPLQPGEAATALDAWTVTFSPSTPDEDRIELAVVTTELGGGTWHDSFTCLVHAPKLEFVTLRRDDSPPYGNGNGTIEDGEAFLLFCTLKNYGTGEAVALTGVIRDLEGGFAITDSVASYVDLAPLSEAENTAGWLLSEANTLVENNLAIEVTDAYGRAIADTVEMREPLAPSNITFDTSMGEDQILVRWFASLSGDVDRYRIYRAKTPGGPYTRANSDLVTHTVYTDVGLDPATRYYYVVTAVDQSGNESPHSGEASASTNPPQLSGWPNLLTDPSSNSTAVGDIDGDGDLEVIVGNDRLYAWHHDGIEVRDGDGDGQSWGVFSDQGENFLGPVALARLDGKPGLEIVAAAYNSKEVYCFDYTGALLPGWPKPTLSGVRTAAVVGDLDGDNNFEIIVVDEEAVMYAWHHDGVEVRDGDGDPGTDGVFVRFPDTPWWHYQTPAVCDIDGDESDEIIVATQDSTLYVLNGNGTDVPGWPKALADFAGGGVAVGDIDDDGDLEIVCPIKNASEIRAFHHDGTTLWTRWFSQNLFFNPSPALADLDGDGKLETVLPSSNGRVYVIRYNGSDFPGWPVYYSTETYTESSPVIADVSGDGLLDIILGDESKFIYAWDTAGNLLDGFPLATQDAVRGTPVVTDLDGDGDVEIVASGYDRTVYVWDVSHAYDPGACPWPESHGNSHRNGCIGYEVPTAATQDRIPLARAGLEQNIPNPFNPVTNISFRVPDGTAGRVTLVVYDVTGARVKTLANGDLPAGRHTRTWDGTNDRGNRVGSGVYFYRLVMPGFADTKKMVLLK
jgi:WD40 repeat protein